MKRCSKCGEEKPVSAFNRARRRPSGYFPRCRDCQNEDQRERYGRESGERRQQRAENMRRYREENRDRIAERRRQRRKGDPEGERARRRASYERRRESVREYNAIHSAERRLARLRARAVAEGAFVEDVHDGDVWQRDRGACGICGESVDPADYHLDHKIAMSRGGKHELANVQLAHPACNMEKRLKSPEEYRRWKDAQ